MIQNKPNTTHFDLVIEGLVRMHRLYQNGLFESEEADQLRDDMDAPWSALSSEEKQILQGLATDLNWVKDTEKNDPAKQMNPLAMRKLREAVDAKGRGEFQFALSLFRRWKDYSPAGPLSWILGMIWSELGYYSVAVLFIEQAVKLSPEDNLYPIMLLDLLLKTDGGKAEDVAFKVLRNLEGMDPEMLVFAISILAIYIRQTNSPIVSTERLRSLLQYRIQEMPRSVKTTALVVISNSYNFAGEKTQAYKAISEAIQSEPGNDMLWVLRGTLYDDGNGFSNEQVLSDYEEAIRLKTAHLRPYYFLTKNYLEQGEILEAKKIAEAGIKKLPLFPSPDKTTNAMASKLLEFVAAINSESGQVDEAGFQRAIAFDKNNGTVSRSLSIARERHQQQRPFEVSPRFTAEMFASARFDSTGAEYKSIYDAQLGLIRKNTEKQFQLTGSSN